MMEWRNRATLKKQVLSSKALDPKINLVHKIISDAYLLSIFSFQKKKTPAAVPVVPQNLPSEHFYCHCF